MGKVVSNFLSSAQTDHSDSQYSSLTTDRKIRLFGFELDKRFGFVEQEEIMHSTCTTEELVKPPMADSKKFKCQYCFKGFENPQALGGHQNAHKRERVKKKKLLLEAREASIKYYLQPFYQVTDDHGININFQDYCGDELPNNNRITAITTATTFGLYDKDLLASFKQRRSSRRMDSSSLADDSKQTYIDLDLELAL